MHIRAYADNSLIIGPGPSNFIRERPEKTAVLGPVRTSLGSNQLNSSVDLKFTYIFDIIFIQIRLKLVEK